MGEGIRRPLSGSIARRAAPSFLVAILLPWSVHAQPPGTWTAAGSVGHVRQGDGPGLSSDSGAFTASGSGALGVDSSQGSVVPAESLASSSSEPSLLQVTYDRPTDQISIHVRNTTLEEVLLEITRKTELSIESRRREIFREQVSFEVDNLPLEQALRKLLQEFNSVFLYSSAVAAPDETATPRLIKVIISSRKATKSLEARAPKDESTYPTKSRNGGPPAVRDGAEMLRALIEGGPEMVTGIVNTLREPAWEQEREQASEALLQVLIDQLNQKDIRSFGHALEALKVLAPEKILRVLADRLQAEDPTARVVAAAGLGLLKDERGIEPLLSVLTGPDLMMREPAANNLAWIGGSRATQALFHAYFVGDNGVKRAVAKAIATGRDSDARAILASVIARGEGPGGPPLHDESRENGGGGDMTPGDRN